MRCLVNINSSEYPTVTLSLNLGQMLAQDGIEQNISFLHTKDVQW